MSHLMDLFSTPSYRTAHEGRNRLALLPSSLGIVLLLLLGCSTAYGQRIQTVALSDASYEAGTEAVAQMEVPVHYAMPELRKPLPEFVYPVKAQTFQIEGRVIAQFLLDEKGKVKDLEIVKGLGYGCDEEVLRVLRLGRFKPALDEEGQPQPTQFVTAFDFQLDRP